MFIRYSAYVELQDELIDTRREFINLSNEHDLLIAKWNELVKQINDKGGTKILTDNANKQLTPDEINLLIKLCHPDKHGGNKQANDITAKLLQLKSK